MKSLILAGNLNVEEVDDDLIIRLRSQVDKLSVFSQVLILSNTLDEEILHSSLRKVEMVKTPKLTSGALATAGFGLSHISENEPFLIIPSNAEIGGNLIQSFAESMVTQRASVGAVIFDGTDPLYSYARIGKSGEIIEIVEKSVSGSCALAGFYYFSNKNHFSNCLEWAMVNNIQNQGKFFISPALNYFLAKSIEISFFEIPNDEYLRY
jgi:hypothetical protein